MTAELLRKDYEFLVCVDKDIMCKIRSQQIEQLLLLLTAQVHEGKTNA